MINITKVHPDPNSLNEFKTLTQNSGPDKSCNYDLLRQPQMKSYKEALLEEQHYLCAYCNRNLDEYLEDEFLHRLKIEHWYPQSLCKAEVNYNTINGMDVCHENMVIVCPGQNVNPNFTHCDSSRKAGKTLTIKPQDPEYKFQNVFRYEGGALKTDIKIIQDDVDDELNLNDEMLIHRRNKVLDQFIKILPPKNTIDKQSLILKYSTPNRENRKREFCTLLIHYIENI